MINPNDIIIALDDGHESYDANGNPIVAGKRTPVFPDGSVMLENEFNRAVVLYLKKHLERLGFKVVLTNPTTDKFTDLKERVNIANNSKANILISVHANALAGKWGTHGGTETFYYKGSLSGKKLANYIHKHIMKGTPLRDRGVKEALFYILRYSNMPSILIEAAFMDNLKEAKLLKSDTFRKECAKEIAMGICEYYGIEYTETPIPTLKPTIEERIDNIMSKYFSDLPGTHWGAKDADELFEAGILKGDTTGKLNYDKEISKIEVVALVNRLRKYLLEELK